MIHCNLIIYNSLLSLIFAFFRMSVRIGEYDISKNIDYEVQEDGTTKYNNPVQDLEVEEIIPYPGYNTSSLVNDIGLIRVSKMNLSMGKY